MIPNEITSPKLVVKSDEFIALYNAAADIINFCYDEGKGWVGTETIRKSGAFVKLVAKLSDAIDPFIPVGEKEDYSDLD